VAESSERAVLAFRLDAVNVKTKAKQRQFKKDLRVAVDVSDLLPSFSRFSVAVWDEDLLVWERIPTTFDEKTKKISAPIPHFSLFAVFLDPPLHAADVDVNGNIFNTANTNPQAGVLDTVTTLITTRRVNLLLSDAAGISKFASDPVPAGKIWSLGGTWTFDTYVRVTGTASGSRFYVRAMAYRISTAGVVTALTGLLSSPLAVRNTTYQLVSWTGTVPATTLNQGERWAAEFYAWSDDNPFPAESFLLGYDTTAQPTGVTPSLVESNAPGVVRENHYRIGQDTALGSMQWYAPADTAAIDMYRSDNFRVRFQVYNDGASAKTWRPRLEWSTAQTTGYAAVPLTSGATPFFVTNTAQFTNGDAIATGVFGLGTSPGAPEAGVAYDTVNPPATGISLTNGAYTEIEFNVQANTNAAWNGTYYFRLTDNATVLSSYFSYATITMKATAGVYQDHTRIGYDRALNNMAWYAGADSPGLVQRSVNFRVRFQIYNDSGATYTWQPRLESSLNAPLSWSAVPLTSGALPFFVTDTSQFANGAAISTAYFALGTGLGTAVDGVAFDTQNPGASFGILNGNYTEIEFNIQANANAVISGDYVFRLTNNGTALTAYQQLGEVIMQSPPGPTPTPGPPAHNGHLAYSNDTAACAACHRVHTAKAPYAVEKRWPEEEVCFTCHDGTGAPNIKTQFLKTYKMPVTDPAKTGIHSLTEAHTKDPSRFSGANRHVECTDCHNPHYAAQGNHPRGSAYSYGPLQGMWGVSATYNDAWTPPTFATVNTVTYEYEVCFKCHSSWAYGASPPMSPSGGFTQTDQSKEFNPLNASYMPVVAQGKNPFIYQAGLRVGQSYAGSLLNGDGGATNRLLPTSRVTCTDCHGSDTQADPAGPHGSTNPFILRRPWSRTTGQNTGNGGVNTSNNLCFLCHDYAMYTNGSNQGNWNQTGFAGEQPNLHAFHVGTKQNRVTGNPVVCMDCHIAIPHGYFRDHLLGFNSDGAPYIDRPGGGGLTTINTWAPSGNWQKTNCQTAMNTCGN